MTPDCLVKIKAVVSNEVFAQFDDALKNGDQKAWDTIMQDSHTDMQFLRRKALIDQDVNTNISEYINSQVDKGIRPERALNDLVSGSSSNQLAGIVSLDKYIEGVHGRMTSRLGELIHATRPKFLGLNRSRDGEYAKQLVKNIFGDSDSKGIKGIDTAVDAWKTYTGEVLTRMNKAGASIQGFEDFLIPLNHNTVKIINAGEEAWVKDALNLFDIRKLPKTVKKGGKNAGKNTVEQTDEALLRGIFGNMAKESDNIIDVEVIGKSGARNMSSIHQKHRWLQPKNGDAWLEYTEKYGNHQSPIDSMLEYTDARSTEIGLMEMFGTDPTKTIKDFSKSMKSGAPLALASFDQIKSFTKAPTIDPPITRILRNFRNFQTATKLGAAPITALSDTQFTAITALYNGMSATKALTRLIKNLNPADNADRKLATRLGLGYEYALSKGVAAYRYSDNNAFGLFHKAADISTRLSGLNHWTNTAKMSFGLSFMERLGEVSTKTYGSLPRKLKRSLERFGITGEDWDSIRKATIVEQGLRFVDPIKIEDDRLASKVIGMVKSETNFAVPEPDSKARAVATAGIPTNTVGNELAKTAGQFKTFGVAVTMSHLGRALDNGNPVANRVGYGVGLFAASAVIGTAIVQLKDISRGLTPREVSPSLVLEGIVQAGAGGLLLDIAAKDPWSYGGLGSVALGPTGSDISDLLKTAWGTAAEFKEGSFNLEEKYGGIAEKGIKLTTRFWHSRLAAERLLMDYVNKETDPQYYKKIRKDRKFINERGQDYWWRPGQNKPEALK